MLCFNVCVCVCVGGGGGGGLQIGVTPGLTPLVAMVTNSFNGLGLQVK